MATNAPASRARAASRGPALVWLAGGKSSGKPTRNEYARYSPTVGAHRMDLGADQRGETIGAERAGVVIGQSKRRENGRRVRRNRSRRVYRPRRLLRPQSAVGKRSNACASCRARNDPASRKEECAWGDRLSPCGGSSFIQRNRDGLFGGMTNHYIRICIGWAFVRPLSRTLRDGD